MSNKCCGLNADSETFFNAASNLNYYGGKATLLDWSICVYMKSSKIISICLENDFDKNLRIKPNKIWKRLLGQKRKKIPHAIER